MNKILIALALVLCAAVAVPAVAHQGKGKSKGKRPDVITIPEPGFQPEGITTSKRHTFFVGSRDSGAIYKGSLRTGEGRDPRARRHRPHEHAGRPRRDRPQGGPLRPPVRLGRQLEAHPRL